MKKAVNNLTLIPKYLILGIKCLFNKKMQKNLKLENKIIPIIVITLSIITYLTCIFLITRWYVQNERSKNFSKNEIKNIETIQNNNNSTTSNNKKEQNSPQKY